MFIRRTTVKSRKAGDHREPYYTYRLVETERVGKQVKQHTLINLGRYFKIPKQDWQMLCARIQEHLDAQSSLLDVSLPEELERIAQRYAAQIIAARGVEVDSSDQDIQSVDLTSMEMIRPRKVGVEQLALSALNELKIPDKLKELGFNRHQLAAAIGNLVARMAFPTSERATHKWLQQRSALGELIGYNFTQMGLERLYRASDLLYQHKEALEAHIYQHERALFGFEQTITLYDLTNTYFEGTAKENTKAQRGRSKEKRHECPLVTLGLVLDGSGFPCRSEMFPGNAAEVKTLEQMLAGLGAREGTVVVLDAGIASEDNIQWLREHNYRYLVVSRKRKRAFDPDEAVTVKPTAKETVQVQRVVNQESGEIELYCYSELRAQKEQAMVNRFSKRFEEALQCLADGLKKNGTTKRYDKVLERVGRIKQKYALVAQHYVIDVIADTTSDKAREVIWRRETKPHSRATHPGVYCLRTDIDTWDEAKLWKTYTMLTDLEAVFRSMKTELGMRPVYHHKERRVDGHLFITLLAYHLVHTLRTKLKSRGINDSWQSLRNTMENHQRITVALKCADGRTVHIRKANRAEPEQTIIYDALGINALPGHVQKTYI